MNKAELLDAIQIERARWEALLAELDEEQMIQPGVAGAWSVKDIVAHISWHEHEMVGMLQARALVGSDLWEIPQGERNAVIFEENQDRPLRDVLAEAQAVFPRFLESVRPLAEEDLLDPHRFQGMPAEWQPWQVIASNSYEHYEHHTQDVRAWLDQATTDSQLR